MNTEATRPALADHRRLSIVDCRLPAAAAAWWLWACLLPAAPLVAADPPPLPLRPPHPPTTAPAAPAADGQQAAGWPTPPPSVTRHSIQVAGRRLDYTATAGFLAVRDERGRAQANIFCVSYVLAGAGAASRPVTFAYNGGPGAASLWVHLGAMGPKRAALADDGKAMPAAFALLDNDQTWLDFTDLVFLDPVGSGYSAPADGVEPKTFWSVDGDARSMAAAVRLWLAQNNRWLSPLLLAGESYGTVRSPAVAAELAERYGLAVRGLVQLSSAMDFQTISFESANDLAYMLFLPTYTAVAWYHHKLPPEMQKDLPGALQRAERLAVGEYAEALSAGDELPAERRRKLAGELSALTGLPAEVVERNGLRVRREVFAKELLRDSSRVVGILDGRIAGESIQPGFSFTEYDPTMTVMMAPFVTTLQDYLRTELRFRFDRPYVPLSRAANEAWQYGSARRGYLNVGPRLKRAMTKQPGLKVFAAAGWFDLTCGYFAQRYMYTHLGLAAPLRGNVAMHYYPSGHQIYTDLPSLKKLRADVAAFVAALK